MTQATSAGLLVLVLILACTPIAVPASQSQHVVREQRPSRAQFAGTVLQALVHAGSARDVLISDVAESQSGDNVVATLFQTMTNKQMAIRRLGTARHLFAADLKSSDSEIREIAQVFDETLQLLQTSFQRGADLDQALLETKTEGEVTRLVPRASQIAADTDEAWRMLPQLILLVSHALVDDSRVVNERRKYLRMTGSERDRLIADIQQFFPGPDAGGSKHAVEASAALLLKFLRGGWKGSNED